jgi:hypothetical protein
MAQLSTEAQSSAPAETALQGPTNPETTAVVSYSDRDATNLLGLILGNVLSRTLQKPALRKKCKALKGEVRVSAGKMEVGLLFEDGGVTIKNNPSPKPKARVGGDLRSLTRVALGDGVLSGYLSGRLQAGGNVYFLLRLLPLLRVSGT